MVEFICGNCGNKELRGQNGKLVSNPKALDVHGQYTCSQCGVELPQEQLRELIKAAAEESVLTMNLLRQAREAKNSGNYEVASELYQQVLCMDPGNWQAAYFSVSCNSRCSYGANENACDAVKLCLEGVFNLIDNLPASEKKDAVKIVVVDACSFAVEMFDAAVKQHAALDVNAMTQNKNNLKNQLISALNITIACASNVINRYGDDDQIAPIVETPATCAIQLQTRQSYVSLVIEPETAKTLLEWIGKFNPKFVEDYKKKQNKSMATGSIVLMVLGAIFLALGLLLEGMFAKWFCLPMAGFCLLYGIFRIIVQAANKKLNG